MLRAAGLVLVFVFLSALHLASAERVSSTIVWLSILFAPGSDLSRPWTELKLARGASAEALSLGALAVRAAPAAALSLLLGVLGLAPPREAFLGAIAAVQVSSVALPLGRAMRGPASTVAACWLATIVLALLTDGRIPPLDPSAALLAPTRLLLSVALLALACCTVDCYLIRNSRASATR